MPSPTYNEIWKVVAGSSGFGATAGSTAAQLAALNTQVSALRGALARQSSGATVLTIADGVWTNGVELNPDYGRSMKMLFNVSVCSGNRRAEQHQQWWQDKQVLPSSSDDALCLTSYPHVCRPRLRLCPMPPPSTSGLNVSPTASSPRWCHPHSPSTW